MKKLESSEDAIKQAGGEGYLVTKIASPHGTGQDWKYFVHSILQDPAFWQALGKARGWTTLENEDCQIAFTLEAKSYPIKPRETMGIEIEDENRAVRFRQRIQSIAHSVSKDWLYYALRYFETLLSGGDMKAFWEFLP